MQIQGWMDDIGLSTHRDSVANVRGRLQGADPEQPAWLVGSHYDTVVDAGRFDGLQGIVTAIAALKALLIEVTSPLPESSCTSPPCLSPDNPALMSLPHDSQMFSQLGDEHIPQLVMIRVVLGVIHTS